MKAFDVLKRLLKVILHVGLPFVLGAGILWWMYRGTDWSDFNALVFHEMNWGWMLLSLLFGIVPQIARAWRWRMALAPLGEDARRSSCTDAIFMSYAASLVVPRIGEITRCGTLKKVDGVSFSKSLGTVVTERIVDSLLMLLFTGVAFFVQLPMLMAFLEKTGFNVHGLLRRFTSTGYLVTFICLVAAVAAFFVMVRRFSFFRKGRDKVRDVRDGILSLRRVRNLPLYLFYSLLIWVGYFLHFYIAFFCFGFTQDIPLGVAFLIFCVGTFAVLVPTPNGAGPWHFAVKTMLVLYGVAETQAVLFALAVHTIQTALVIVLGAFGWARANMRKPKETIN